MNEYTHDKLRLPAEEPHSGDDIDLWGGEDTHPNAVPRPNTDDPCWLKDADGRCTCTPGSERCRWFLDG